VRAKAEVGLSADRMGGETEAVSTGIDPRIRLVAVVAFAFVIVSLKALSALAVAFFLSCIALVVARPPAGLVVRRVLALDLLMLMVVVTLPFAIPGEPLVQWGGLAASRDGMVRVVEVLAKANAVVLMLLALLHGIPAPTMGHALQRLGVPDRLIHILFFTVRYLDTISAEYHRLRRAMTARAFRPRTDRHTWRSLGWLVGMLLVRSFERAERVLAAMKCRGFDGRLFTYADLRLRATDWTFLAVSGALAAALLWLDRL
jgi:cobalt/nickel transport system permease protein